MAARRAARTLGQGPARQSAKGCGALCLTRILLTGKDGQVGGELLVALAPLGEVLACDRKRLDLADPAAITAAVREFRPAIIVNAAAYTAVDGAESAPDLAMTVNGVARGILAAEARRLGAWVV